MGIIYDHFFPLSFCVSVTFPEYAHFNAISTIVRQAKVLGYWGKTITLFDITYKCSLKRSANMRLVSPMYAFLHF